MSDNDISSCVRGALEIYFRDLDGEPPHAVYDMLLACVEKPMLEYVLNHANGNQSKAAEILGLNRNTLRKKLKQYNMQ
ncbi:MAG TPA: Fis family transcriptional regulator [Methylophilaceae bacterium]|nr:Fis family transcriptional regulator [Methylophilaceae bacterium]HQR60176.1 Fis family transcriptional regulator [Methylophilaceae bacterium]